MAQVTETPDHEVRLAQGTIHYRDTGSGPPLVFVHGLLVNGLLWRKVVPELSGEFRCVVPDWPLGSHAVPMAPEADLSPPGVARLISEFLAALDLDEAAMLVAQSRDEGRTREEVGRIVARLLRGLRAGDQPGD